MLRAPGERDGQKTDGHVRIYLNVPCDIFMNIKCNSAFCFSRCKRLHVAQRHAVVRNMWISFVILFCKNTKTYLKKTTIGYIKM